MAEAAKKPVSSGFAGQRPQGHTDRIESIMKPLDHSRFAAPAFDRAD